MSYIDGTGHVWEDEATEEDELEGRILDRLLLVAYIFMVVLALSIVLVMHLLGA